MSAPNAIEARALAKRYRIGGPQAGSHSLRETLASVVTAPFSRANQLLGRGKKEQDFWALKDIDLAIAPGEVVGIIGRNGSGKSTLLKLLARVTAPTSGTATIRGRVGSLLEVGTGFHPDLTARENIFLNGALLGMSRREMRAQLDAIVAFSEVEQFLETPVKRFSTGMYIRLGFAVAAHIRSDILLIDEVLAVGDAAFQQKCLAKMDALSGEGRTVLFVSHQMATVRSLCPRTIWLDEGHVVEDGPTLSVIERYLTQSAGAASPEGKTQFSPPHQKTRAHLVSAWVGAASDSATSSPTDTSFKCEDGAAIFVAVAVDEPEKGLSLLVKMYQSDGACVLSSEDTDGGETPLGDVDAGVHTLRVDLPGSLFAPGHYRLEFELVSMTDSRIHAPPQTVSLAFHDVGTWRSSRAPYRGGGLVAPTLTFSVVGSAATMASATSDTPRT